MLSVCIPIYEHDVRGLVQELARQAEAWDREAELVLIDDASSATIRALNAPVCKEHVYIELEDNLGRARVRNLFPRYARYDHLLYLDCDSLIPSSDFLSSYGEALERSGADLICGGRRYPEEGPERKKRLSWMHGVKRESRPAAERQGDPYQGFLANNFLVHRRLIEEEGFDERIRSYGHEDTLFGLRMKKRGVRTEHIENPVLNGHIEDNELFLEKTRQGIRNLAWILRLLEEDPDLMKSVRMLRVYRSMRNRGGLFLFRPFFFLFEPLIRKMLVSGNAGLRSFDLYKLGVLDRWMRKEGGGSGTDLR